MSTNNTENTKVPQDAGDSAQRRNVQISAETWTGIKLIAAKTGESLSDVVERGLSSFVRVEVPRLLGKKSVGSAAR